MKKILLFVLVLASVQMNGQELSDQQWTLVSKKTATWCSFCGQYGWNFKTQLLEQSENKPALIWAVHYSGNLETPTSKAMSDNFPAAGQPRFFLNNEEMGVTSSNISSKLEEFALVIDGSATFPPLAGVGSDAFFDGEKITVTSRVKFNDFLEGGDYWLSSYLVDDELVAFQQSQGNNAVHKNVLLHSFTGDQYFGENIVSGEVQADAEYFVNGELDFSGDTNIPDYSDGYSVATILWTLIDGNYTPFNINVQPVKLLVSTSEEFESISATVNQVSESELALNINSDQVLPSVNLQLLDMQGRTVYNETQNINNGKNVIMINISDVNTGAYIIKIQNDNMSKSIRTVVR